AGLRTFPQVRRDVNKAIAKVDPEDFSKRHRRARTGRRVSAPQVLPDGMASMRLVTAAADAMALHTALEAAARTARNSGGPRTLEQLRADVLATMGHTALATGHIGPCTNCAHPDQDPPAPAAPGARQDHPADTDTAAGAGADDAHGAGAAFGLGTVGGAKAQIRITVPLSTLMGTSNTAADLEGYGPIPADVARAYAAGGTWKRLVTDPLTHRAVEVTAKRYEPPGWLREQIIADEPFCTAPGCNIGARHADLDHGVPFPACPTRACNLHPQCRHHHQLKTEGHLGYTSPEPGVHEWTTPTGHRYRTDPSGTHLLPPEGAERIGSEREPSGARAGPSHTSPARGPTYPTEDDPPPF